MIKKVAILVNGGVCSGLKRVIRGKISYYKGVLEEMVREEVSRHKKK